MGGLRRGRERGERGGRERGEGGGRERRENGRVKKRDEICSRGVYLCWLSQGTKLKNLDKLIIKSCLTKPGTA